jgi:hypothetical protein
MAEDSAACPACGAEHRLSILVAETETRRTAETNRAEAAAEPPQGAWRRFEADRVLLGATHRSLGNAALMLGIALFWNGITSVFVLFAAAGTLRLFGIRPAFFDGVSFASESGDLPSPGAMIFLWLFLTPFMLIGAALCLAFVNALFGRTEIRVAPSAASLFQGIGPFGRTRRFDPAQVRAVFEENYVSGRGDENAKATRLVIEREGAKPLRFGSSLSEPRRRFLLANLRELLLRPVGSRSASAEP